MEQDQLRIALKEILIDKLIAAVRHPASRNLAGMTAEELENYLSELNDQLDTHIKSEPDGADCTEYDEWDDHLSELESLTGAAEDRLCELRSLHVSYIDSTCKDDD